MTIRRRPRKRADTSVRQQARSRRRTRRSPERDSVQTIDSAITASAQRREQQPVRVAGRHRAEPLPPRQLAARSVLHHQRAHIARRQRGRHQHPAGEMIPVDERAERVAGRVDRRPHPVQLPVERAALDDAEQRHREAQPRKPADQPLHAHARHHRRGAGEEEAQREKERQPFHRRGRRNRHRMARRSGGGLRRGVAADRLAARPRRSPGSRARARRRAAGSAAARRRRRPPSSATNTPRTG